MRLLLLFLFQIYSLPTTFQSNFSSRPYSYETKPKPLHVENRHVRLRTLTEGPNMEYYLKQAKMTYDKLVNIGEENFVSVTIDPSLDPSLIDPTIYMNVTDVCREDENLLCIRTEQDHDDHKPDFIQHLEVKRLHRGNDGVYRGSYRIHATTSGYITISIYMESSGLRGACNNGAWFSGSFVGARVDSTLSHEWGIGQEDCFGLVNDFSIRWKGKLIVLEPGNYCFQMNGASAAKLYVNWDEILELPESGTEVLNDPIHLNYGLNDFVLDYNKEEDMGGIQLSWASCGDDLDIMRGESLIHVSSIQVSEDIEVTCKPGYYLDGASEGCERCPEGTYKDFEGLQECTPCPAMTYSNIMGASHCSDCHPLCQACFGPSKEECSSCIESSGAKKFGTTTCDCPEDSYYSSSDNRCIPCHPFCLGCFDSPDKCKKCDTRISYSVIDKINYCVYYCEDGYYEDDTVCKRILYSIIL